MKNLIRIAILLLALLMVVPCLAACGNGSGNDTTVDNSNGQNPGGEDETTTEKDPDYIEPKKLGTDAGDYVYKAYVRSNQNGGDMKNGGNPGFYCEDFWVADTSEDALTFAVYTRNQTIQETFGCRIVQVDSTRHMYEELKDYYQNSETHDLAIILAVGAATAATSNLLQDINSLEYIELDHRSYDQNSIAQLSMGGKLYYLSGDMNISTMDNTASTIVNLGMYKALGETLVDTFGDEVYADPYKLVTEKLWDMDTMLTIAELATVDMNKSDGVTDSSKGDTVGYFEYSATPLYYFYSSGARLSSIDEDGYPEFTINNDYAQEVYDYIFRNLNHAANPWIASSSGQRMNNVKSGNLLFVDFILWDVRKQLYSGNYYSEGYGVLPTPMYDVDAQEGQYYSAVFFQDCVHLWAIPQMCTNADNAAFLFHVMAVYSSKKDSTMDAYYQKTMYMTVATDMGSRACMDIIRTTMVYDIAQLYNWGTFSSDIQNIDTVSANGYANMVNKLDTAEEEMNLTLEKFKNPQYVPDAQ